MKLRMIALPVIFALAAWLPDAAQQTPASQSATQSQAPGAAAAPDKGAANPACACCDHAKHHGKKSSADHQAQACCLGRDSTHMTCCHPDSTDAKAAMNCCNGKDAKTSTAKNGKSCCNAGNGKSCCETKDGKPCCGNDAIACSSKDGKGCCAAATENCCAPARGK